MVAMWVIAVALISLVNADFHPKVCQKLMGVRSAKMPNPRICHSEPSKATLVLADDYSEKSTSGRLIMKKRSTCDVYENMLTVTRTRSTESSIPIYVSEHHMLSQGLCPYKSGPLPYYTTMRAECVTSYLSETSTVLNYCLTMMTQVTRLHGNRIRCDRVDTDNCKYNEGMCAIGADALLTWNVDQSHTNRITVWKGEATYYDKIVVIPEIQEAYNLKQALQLGELETQENLTIKVTRMQDTSTIDQSARSRRSSNTMVGQAVDVLHTEMNGKLQYFTATVLVPLKSTVESICTGLGIHASMIYSLVDKSPDEYIRWILGDAYLTAVIMDDIILYWPCRRVESWHTRPNLTSCYADLPIQFHNGDAWMEGYMDTRTGDISLTSTQVACNTSVHCYRQGSNYYRMQGTQVTIMSLTTTSRLPVRVNNTVLRNILIPKWENTWIYNSSMFIQQDHDTSGVGVLSDRYDNLMSYVEHTTPDSQIRYIADQMGVGAWHPME